VGGVSWACVEDGPEGAGAGVSEGEGGRGREGKGRVRVCIVGGKGWVGS
jgi:hypothetical protein